MSKLLEDDGSDTSPNVYTMCAQYYYADSIWGLPQNYSTHWPSFDDFMNASENDIFIGFDSKNFVTARLEHSVTNDPWGTYPSSETTYDLFSGVSEPYNMSIWNGTTGQYETKSVVSKIIFYRGIEDHDTLGGEVVILDAETEEVIPV